jgi:DNA-binding transcriptional ArsR family regulator
MKNIFVAAVTLLLFVELVAVPVLAEKPKALFIVSDEGDKIFLKKLGLRMDIAQCMPSGNISGYDIVFVLDYNIGDRGCREFPRGLFKDLLSAARGGATIIVGFNTLRMIMAYEPQAVRDLGIAALLDDKGTHNIFIVSSLTEKGAPGTLVYDSSRYYRFVALPHSGWRILARFDDNAPAIVEQRVGRGRLVIMFFNPVWPSLEGYKGYSRLVRALYSYYAGSTGPPVQGVVAVAALTGITMASSLALQRSDEAARRAGKPVITVAALLAHRVRREKLHEHPVRRRILELLETKPYITVQDLLAQGVKRSTAIWHLELLVSLGVLSARRIAGKTIYYRRERYREAILAFLMESEHRRRIIEELAMGVYTLSKLAERLGLNRSTVKHHIDLLLALGIIRDVGSGYTVSDWVRGLLGKIRGMRL